MLMHPAFISLSYYVVEAVHNELPDLGVPQVNHLDIVRVVSYQWRCRGFNRALTILLTLHCVIRRGEFFRLDESGRPKIVDEIRAFPESTLLFYFFFDWQFQDGASATCTRSSIVLQKLILVVYVPQIS